MNTRRSLYGEPAGHLAPGWLSGGIASEEVDRKRIGQRLSIHLSRLALGVDGCLQHQRDVVVEQVVDGKWSISSAHSTWSDVGAVCTSRAGCTEGVRPSPCPWSHIRTPVASGSLLWRGARSSSGSRYKVRRAASLAQSIAGTGGEGHIVRVDTDGLARCPASVAVLGRQHTQ